MTSPIRIQRLTAAAITAAAIGAGSAAGFAAEPGFTTDASYRAYLRLNGFGVANAPAGVADNPDREVVYDSYRAYLRLNGFMEVGRNTALNEPDPGLRYDGYRAYRRLQGFAHPDVPGK